ncbi:MAG: DotI/IcmL family type IV secretion protein [Gammaproteobacteria bacterium]
MFFFLALVVILASSLFVLYKEIETYNQPIYLLTDPDGNTIPDVPVWQPLDNRYILRWVENTVPEIYNFDFVNYLQLFYTKRIYFTIPGLENFVRALVNSANLESVKARKQVVYSEIIGRAKIINQGSVAGHVMWAVSLPLRVKYENAPGESLIQDGVAYLQIIRGDILLTVNNGGLAVHQFVFQENTDARK